MMALRSALAAVMALIAGLLLLGGRCVAQTRFDVYVLAIGSTNYAEPTGPDLHGLSRIDGANESARLVGDRLRRGGARYSLVLTSTEEAYTGLKDISAALGKVSARIARDRPAHPLLVVYFAGHGMAEGFGWNHYSIPGDMLYRGDPDRLPVQDLTRYTLHAASFADRLKKLRHPYLLILDTCSEGKPARFDSPVLTPTASQNLGGIAEALRVVNDLRQPDPVVFSASPGDVAQTAVNPVDQGGDRIAPMARRLLLLLDPAEKARRPVSLTGLVGALTSRSVDPATRPGITHAVLGPSAASVLYVPGAAPGPLVSQDATTTQAHICCQGPPGTGPKPLSMSGTLTFKSAPGEFITDGRSFSLATPRAPMTLEQTGETYRITAGREPDAWSVELAAPKGQRLAVGVYPGAQRQAFQDAGHPGLAVSAPSSSCNTVKGSITITRLHRDGAGRVDALEGSVRQLCEDLPAVLVVDLSLARAGPVQASAAGAR